MSRLTQQRIIDVAVRLHAIAPAHIQRISGVVPGKEAARRKQQHDIVVITADASVADLGSQTGAGKVGADDGPFWKVAKRPNCFVARPVVVDDHQRIAILQLDLTDPPEVERDAVASRRNGYSARDIT